MAAKAKVRKLIAAVVLGFTFGAICLNAQKMPSLQLVTTVRNDVFAQGPEKALIVGVDISPDASRLGVLYATGTNAKRPPVYDQLWLALWDINTEKLLKRTELAQSDQNSDVFTIGPLDVKFTDDQQYLVILGLRQVWLVGSQDGSIRKSIRDTDLGFPVQILFASNSEVAITYARDGGGPFNTTLYELPSSAQVAGWISKDLPQSFSPNSQLAATSDTNSYNPGGVSNIAIIDSRTGQTTRTISVGFAFPKGRFGKREGHGSVVVSFINDKELIVMPDGSRDSAGHHSGDGVEIIDAVDGNLERQIAIDSYGPTGTVAVSTDRRWIALDSIYAKPVWFAKHSTNSSHFVHTLRLLKTDGGNSQFLVGWPDSQMSRDSFPAFSVPPRISSAGPTAVITTGNEISVFSVKK